MYEAHDDYKNTQKGKCDARTICDARGLSGARAEWIAHLSTISPPRSYLAPVLAKGQPKFRLFGEGNFGLDPSKTHFSTAY